MQTDLPKTLAAVIPMFNEAGNAVDLLTEVVAGLSATDVDRWQIVVVDDASSDSTAAELQAFAKRCPQLTIITHASNRGQSSAILTGARAADTTWLVTLDGDGQNDPADIPKLWQTVRPGACAVGNRTQRRDSWSKRVSSKIANAIRQALLNDQCPDTGCGLKCFERAAFLKLPHFNHYHRYLPALFANAGLTVLNVPVNHRPREHGQSKYTNWGRLKVGIVDLCGVIWLLRRNCQAEVRDV